MDEMRDDSSADDDSTAIFIRIDPIGRQGRQIKSNFDPFQRLTERIDDLRNGIASSASVIASALPEIRSPDGWEVETVEAKFGLSLGAEGSIVVTTTSIDASVEVTLAFKRR